MRRKIRKDVQSFARLFTPHIAPRFWTWSGLLLSASLLLSAPGHAAVQPGFGGKIQHVVVIFQENRTPDSLFHGLRGADIANSGVNSKGKIVRLVPISLAAPYDLDHSHGAFVAMYHDGKMDGADKVYVKCLNNRVKNCVPQNPQFVYVNPSEVKPYFLLAERYTFGDRMFQTNQGPSFPAHQFIIGGHLRPDRNQRVVRRRKPQWRSRSL